MGRKHLGIVGTCVSALALPLALLLRTKRRRRAASAIVIILGPGALAGPVSARRSTADRLPALPDVEELTALIGGGIEEAPPALLKQLSDAGRQNEPAPPSETGATAVPRPSTSQEAEPRAPRWNVSELSNHSFPEAYLALVSMMESLAVGFLADRMIVGRVVGAAQGVGYAICTMMVITVWDNYLAGSTICRWFPSLLDASIPAGLGLTECFLIVSVASGTKVFLFRLGLFLIVGTTAYWNWWARARRHKEDPHKKKAYQFLRPYILFGCIACPTVAASAFVLAGLYTPADSLSDMVLVLALVTPMFLQSIITWSLRRYLWQLSEDQRMRKHRKVK
jgi:hypothetical protein